MGLNLFELLPDEREALLEALRRDLRSERRLAISDAAWEGWHQRNVRLNIRLLEAINPKSQDCARQVCNKCGEKPPFLPLIPAECFLYYNEAVGETLWKRIKRFFDFVRLSF